MLTTSNKPEVMEVLTRGRAPPAVVRRRKAGDGQREFEPNKTVLMMARQCDVNLESSETGGFPAVEGESNGIRDQALEQFAQAHEFRPLLTSDSSSGPDWYRRQAVST